MLRKLTVLLGLILIAGLVQAQKPNGFIRGKLVDSTVQQPIADATLTLLQATDSTLVTFTLSNKDGNFEIRGLVAGNYRLLISHEGFDPATRMLSITETRKELDLGTIYPSKKL